MLFLILFLTITLWQFDRIELIDSFRHISPGLILSLIGLQIISQLLLNTLWYQVAHFTKTNISFWRMFYVNCQGSIIDAVTPGVKFGGEVTRAVQISRLANCSVKQGATTVAIQKTFSLSSLFLLLLVSVGFFMHGTLFPQIPFLRILLFLLLILLFVIFTMILLMPQRIQSYFFKNAEMQQKTQGTIRRFCFTFLTHLIRIRKEKRTFVLLFVLSFLMWALYPIKLYLIALQFAATAPSLSLGTIGFAAYMVAMLPLFPGGLGGFEGTMSALLVGYGFIISDAAVITILFRFFSFWLVMLGSLGFVLLTKFRNLSFRIPFSNQMNQYKNRCKQ